MSSVCFYFQVHQPYRIKKYTFFDIGRSHDYFENAVHFGHDNRAIFQKVAQKCYIPANQVLLEILQSHPEVKFSFSLSGVFLQQAQEFAPEVIDSFRRLVETGRVEILAETYYHSLSFLYSKREFREQVKQHEKLIKELFDYQPRVFRNTELIYNNELAKEIEDLGYQAILTEGADHILNWRSPNFVYHPVGTSKLKLLLKNYKLSDDMAFRFSAREWKEWPLTAPKFANWVHQVNGSGRVVNLFMDYETFGEHQWADTGIFDFLRSLPTEILSHPDNDFVTPSEAAERFDSQGEVDIHSYISWADSERDLSAWKSNSMQHDALEKIYELESRVKNIDDDRLLEDWRRLQTSDHFYYMSTKFWNDGDVHKYFSPYDSPYEAYIYYCNALVDLGLRITKAEQPVESKSYEVVAEESPLLSSWRLQFVEEVE